LAREKKKPRMDWAAVAIMKCHRNGVALAQQDPEAIRGCSTSEDPNARRLPCQAPVSLLPFVSQLLTMRSNRKPYVVALERVGASTIMAAIRPTARARAIEAATEVVGTIQRNGIRVLHRHSTNNFGMPLAANHGPKRSNSDRLAFACPRFVTKILAGLMSRWMMPSACAASSASTISMASERISSVSIGRPATQCFS